MKSLALACTALLITLTLSLTACVQSPTITARSAQLQQLTFDGMRVMVNLDLNNPNDVALPLEKVNWNLTLSERPFSNGVVALTETLPALKTSAIQVPLQINYQDSISTALDIIRGRNIPYTLSGRLHFTTPAGVIDTPFAIRGQWDNPMVSMRSGEALTVRAEVAAPVVQPGEKFSK